ncbi:hypothetical protein [Chryseobacterium salviniae]|uniref:Uncharacterized protein n=1 Tax=Chryseobacterium salviniae TaxID=3101750 RepID=A0ABU6HQ83_9FLAO|nr:hypothetical protein [Chryseobacterium sp. T9W2-O]MEC3875205.1 hypothetical protein [Chryseobacterium sp. T9W2-O]
MTGILSKISKNRRNPSKKNNLICNFAVLKNLRIHIGIITLICLGFFLIPTQSYACSKKSTRTEQASCEKEHSKKSEHKSSCKDKSCKKCKDGHDCGGNCKHSSCRCGASTTSLNLPIVIELKAKNLFAAAKKQKFGFKQAYYSSGFFSIWLPPKIS